MNPFIRSEIKGLKPLSVETSILGYSKLNSMLSDAADSSEKSQLVQMTNSGKSVSQSNSIFSNVDHDIDEEVLDGTNFNRDTMPPNTIIVTSANLVGHGDVPMVESTNMGPAMYFQLSVLDGEINVHVDVAKKNSELHHKPVMDHHLHPEPKRIEVGARGRRPLFEYDFESGEAMHIFDEEIVAIFVQGGITENQNTSGLVGPMMVAVFKDKPQIVEYQVGYVHLECKPIGNNSKYFQVFHCPGNHDHCSH